MTTRRRSIATRRRFAYLGPAETAPDPARQALRIPVEQGLLPSALGALAAVVGGGRLAAEARRSLPIEALADLAARLSAARYGAIVWESAFFAEPAQAMILRILRLLNRETRCVGLPLGGGGNAQGAAQAMLWQAGWPGRLSFAAGVPEHDPYLYDATRLIAAGEVDLVLWASPLSDLPPPAVAVPMIALLAPDCVPAAPPQVEIRVGIPGIDHGGTMLRADTVVAIPMTPARPSGRPTVAAVAQAILDRLVLPVAT